MVQIKALKISALSHSLPPLLFSWIDSQTLQRIGWDTEFHVALFLSWNAVFHVTASPGAISVQQTLTIAHFHIFQEGEKLLFIRRILSNWQPSQILQLSKC